MQNCLTVAQLKIGTWVSSSHIQIQSHWCNTKNTLLRVSHNQPFDHLAYIPEHMCKGISFDEFKPRTPLFEF